MLIEDRIALVGGVITEHIRDCKLRLDQCTAEVERTHQRISQEWFRDLSEQESSDEILQRLDDRPIHGPKRATPKRRPTVPTRAPLREVDPVLTQLQQEAQEQGLDVTPS